MGYAKGILAHLLTNLPASRAVLIDNLNATISSRAPAGTALSNAIWTNALAANLATLAAGGRAAVNVAVQRGRTAVPPGPGGSTFEIAISPVNLSRSELNILSSGGWSVSHILTSTSIAVIRESTFPGNQMTSWEVRTYN